MKKPTSPLPQKTKKLSKSIIIFLVGIFLTALVVMQVIGSMKIYPAKFIGTNNAALSYYTEMKNPKLVGVAPIAKSEYEILIVRGDVAGKQTSRVFFKKADDANATYGGEIKEIFGEKWFQALAVEIDGKPVLVGYTDVAKPLYARVERPRNSASWYCDYFESSVQNSHFIMPLTQVANNPNGNCTEGYWGELDSIMIQTKESLKRGFDGMGSYYEEEKKFSPAIEVAF
jgi:hypothetical protein